MILLGRLFKHYDVIDTLADSREKPMAWNPEERIQAMLRVEA
jgi:hypothetical protein